MTLLKLPAAVAFIGCLCALWAKQPPSPVYINPTLTQFDSFPDISGIHTKYAVDTVLDPPGMGDSCILGYTRTGRKAKAPVICKPSPAIVIHRSLTGLLENKGLLATDSASAGYIIGTYLREFELKETTKFMRQDMTARIKFEIRFNNTSDPSSNKRFIFETENSKGTFDATKKAESIARGAIEAALVEIFKTMKTM